MNERGRRFSHLSWHNRLKIDKMLKEGYKAQEIADALHVHNSTIYREIKRGLTVQRTSELVDREVYCPDTAQRKYEESKSVPENRKRPRACCVHRGQDPQRAFFARGGACENQRGRQDLLRYHQRVDAIPVHRQGRIPEYHE